MKKTLNLLMVLMACNVITLTAQDMKFGIKTSLLGSSFSTPENGLYNFRLGYSIGGFFQYNFLDNLGVSIEPAFAKKGANKFDAYIIYDPYSPIFWDGTTPIEYSQHAISMTVIELPVLGQFIMGKGGNGVRIMAGPSIDFISKVIHTKSRINPLASDSSEEIESSGDVTERFKYVDYGMQAGVGFDMELDPVDISVELKYRFGFSDINNVKGKTSLRNQNFGITLGIGLDKLFF